MSISATFANGMPKTFRCDGCRDQDEATTGVLPAGWVIRKQKSELGPPLIMHYCGRCQGKG